MDNPCKVLIVTATKVESLAVLAVFEQATKQKWRTVSIADRVYREFGTLNGTQVYLTLSEMGSGGLGAAQQTVHKGIAALRPDAVVMVGIAFGLDDKKQAIGDILVSQQLMLYDIQRVGKEAILPRGDRPHASPWLLNHLKSADLDWSGATVRFGLLLTGEKLIDNIDYREALRELEPEAIGGEMEGSGLYVACQDAKVDWILIKAICDFADGHKSEDKATRQRLAAENSAAFLAHALLHAALKTASPAAAVHPTTWPSRSPVAPLPGQRPTRSSLRKLLGQILRTVDDLNAFCIDYFEDAARRFSGGMSRLAREDILLDLIETQEILAKLRTHSPAAVARYEALLQYE